MRLTTEQRHIDAARAEARDEILRDADTMAEWLSTQCMYRALTKVRVHLTADKLQQLIDDGLPTADLFAISMDAGQPRECRTLALDTIAERYLATRADDIKRMAEARAGEIAEQELADAREAA